MRHVTLVTYDAVLNLEFRGRSAHVNQLVRQLHELWKIQWPVIERARQAKPVLNEDCFARLIAFIHPANLRNGRMRLVDHSQEIFWEEIDDGIRL